MTQNPTITGRLQDIIAARLKTLTDIIRSTCAAVGEKTQAAIIADLEDLLQDTFTGLHATIEDIDAIGQRTTEQEWESAYSRSLEIRTLIQDYEHLNLIRHFVRVGHKLTGTEFCFCRVLIRSEYPPAADEVALPPAAEAAVDHTSVGRAGVDDGAAAGADSDVAADHDDIAGLKIAEAVDSAASAGACPAAAGHIGLAHAGLVQAPVDEA